MILLYIILTIIVALLVVVFIAAGSAPDSFEVFAETVIDKPVATVYDYARFLENQDKFNKWVMTDPNVKRTYTGTDGQVGGTVYWDSEMGQVGKGAQEITVLTANKRIEWAISFEKPFKNEAGSYLETTEITPDTTKVKWAFTGQLTYMMKVMHVLLSLKKALTKDLQISIDNLKAVLEK